jgi:hypothetical protein
MSHYAEAKLRRFFVLVLLTEAELLDERPVAFVIFPSEVLEQAGAFAHHHHQASPTREIVLVILHVLRDLLDFFGQECDLHLGGAGVGVASAVITDDLCSFFQRQSHVGKPHQSQGNGTAPAALHYFDKQQE